MGTRQRKRNRVNVANKFEFPFEDQELKDIHDLVAEARRRLTPYKDNRLSREACAHLGDARIAIRLLEVNNR